MKDPFKNSLAGIDTGAAERALYILQPTDAQLLLPTAVILDGMHRIPK